MTPLQITLLVAGMLTMDTVIVGALLAGLKSGTWDPLTKKFPPRPVVEPSERRDFQSFAFDMFNLGFCIHVTIDEHCLHLHPAAILRWTGATPMSIPWDAIELKDKPDRKWGLKARVHKTTVKGPTWCMKLAAK